MDRGRAGVTKGPIWDKSEVFLPNNYSSLSGCMPSRKSSRSRVYSLAEVLPWHTNTICLPNNVWESTMPTKLPALQLSGISIYWLPKWFPMHWWSWWPRRCWRLSTSTLLGRIITSYHQNTTFSVFSHLGINSGTLLPWSIHLNAVAFSFNFRRVIEQMCTRSSRCPPSLRWFWLGILVGQYMYVWCWFSTWSKLGQKVGQDNHF